MREQWTHKYTSRRNYLGQWHNRYKPVIEVEAGLRQLGGSPRPCFSVTGTIGTLLKSGRIADDGSGGCLHKEILKHWPQLAPVVALHLCDDTGQPMHAESSGWYSLAGYYGGAGQDYHVGSSDRHFPQEPPADKPWQTTAYRRPTQDECLTIFAEHVRIPVDEARQLAEIWRSLLLPTGAEQDPFATVCERRSDERARWAPVKAAYASWLETQTPRWQAEADAAVALLDSLIDAQERARHGDKVHFQQRQDVAAGKL